MPVYRRRVLRLTHAWSLSLDRIGCETRHGAGRFDEPARSTAIALPLISPKTLYRCLLPAESQQLTRRVGHA